MSSSIRILLNPCTSAEVMRPVRRDFLYPRKRMRLSREAVAALQRWLDKNLDHPYPSQKDKEMLEAETGLTRSRVNNWFSSARRRIVQEHRRSFLPSSQAAVEDSDSEDM